jgi:futalosine hydrolase
LEFEALRDPGATAVDHHLKLFRDEENYWAICGIGPAAAAATTTLLLKQLQPESVLLLGIAGALPSAGLELGALVQAGSESFADLGYRDDSGYHSLDQMGLPLLPLQKGHLSCRFELSTVDRELPTAPFYTVSNITADGETAELHGQHHRGGIENMEGAAVALACSLQDVRCSQLRAVSNLVGPRNPAAWRVKEALSALRRWLYRE